MSVCAHGQVFTQPYCWHAAKAELEDYPIPVLEDFAQADRVEGQRVVRGYSLLFTSLRGSKLMYERADAMVFCL